MKDTVCTSELTEVKTIKGEWVRVLKSRLIDSGFMVLSTYTKQGKRKAGKVNKTAIQAEHIQH